MDLVKQILDIYYYPIEINRLTILDTFDLEDGGTKIICQYNEEFISVIFNTNEEGLLDKGFFYYITNSENHLMNLSIAYYDNGQRIGKAMEINFSEKELFEYTYSDSNYPETITPYIFNFEDLTIQQLLDGNPFLEYIFTGRSESLTLNIPRNDTFRMEFVDKSLLIYSFITNTTTIMKDKFIAIAPYNSRDILQVEFHDEYVELLLSDDRVVAEENIPNPEGINYTLRYGY